MYAFHDPISDTYDCTNACFSELIMFQKVATIVLLISNFTKVCHYPLDKTRCLLYRSRAEFVLSKLVLKNGTLIFNCFGNMQKPNYSKEIDRNHFQLANLLSYIETNTSESYTICLIICRFCTLCWKWMASLSFIVFCPWLCGTSSLDRRRVQRSPSHAI